MAAGFAEYFHKQIRCPVDHFRCIVKSSCSVDIAIDGQNFRYAVQRAQFPLQHRQLSQRAGLCRGIAFFHGSINPGQPGNDAVRSRRNNAGEINYAAGLFGGNIISARGWWGGQGKAECLQVFFSFAICTHAPECSTVARLNFLGTIGPLTLAWAMFRAFLIGVSVALVSIAPADDWKTILHAERSSPGDLEFSGEIAGAPAGDSRYVSYQDLLRLPQETYSIADDSNFHGKTDVSGVALSTLAETFSKSSDLIVAICYDHYRTNYPKNYLSAHHPILVLRINGQDREHWPSATSGDSMAPYVISHPEFKPSFKVLSHEDEPQIPYGVVRIEFRKEAEVFGAIRPRGKWTTDSPVGMGYVIARQDCFRCHNMGAEGGTMAQRSWPQLADIANKDQARFRAIIRNPPAVTPGAKMPAQPGYDDATLDALTAYFRTFSGQDPDADIPVKKDSHP